MNSLKSRAMNCGPLSVMIPGPTPGKLFAGALNDDLNVSFGHALADLPVHDKAAVAVQDGAQVVEGRANVDIGDICW